MKDKISITMEKDVLDSIKDNLEDGLFRNTSHFIEYAVKRFLKER